MDNDFQYPPSQRTEREEYRSRFRFTDEDAPKRSKASQGKPKTKTDYFVRLILLQTILCILTVGGIFLTSKISPTAYEKMKTDYCRIMQRDMSAGEIMGQIKNAAEFVFKPADIAESVSGAGNAETTAAPELGEEYSVNSYQVTSDDTGETVAVGEIIGEGSGGGDMEKKEAAQGTSFAPYHVSVKPVLPVKGARITSKFGYRINPISGNYGFHTGLDLAAEEGTPVSASFYGRVIETGESDVWGKYVLMEHSDSFRTYYCHLSEIYAEEGAVIRQGETIGLVGSTGWSTGPHLHFEVRINGIRVNPEPLLYPASENEA